MSASGAPAQPMAGAPSSSPASGSPAARLTAGGLLSSGGASAAPANTQSLSLQESSSRRQPQGNSSSAASASGAASQPPPAKRARVDGGPAVPAAAASSPRPTGGSNIVGLFSKRDGGSAAAVAAAASSVGSNIHGLFSSGASSVKDSGGSASSGVSASATAHRLSHTSPALLTAFPGAPNFGAEWCAGHSGHEGHWSFSFNSLSPEADVGYVTLRLVASGVTVGITQGQPEPLAASPTHATLHAEHACFLREVIKKHVGHKGSAHTLDMSLPQFMAWSQLASKHYFIRTADVVQLLLDILGPGLLGAFKSCPRNCVEQQPPAYLELSRQQKRKVADLEDRLAQAKPGSDDYRSLMGEYLTLRYGPEASVGTPLPGWLYLNSDTYHQFRPPGYRHRFECGYTTEPEERLRNFLTHGMDNRWLLTVRVNNVLRANAAALAALVAHQPGATIIPGRLKWFNFQPGEFRGGGGAVAAGGGAAAVAAAGAAGGITLAQLCQCIVTAVTPWIVGGAAGVHHDAGPAQQVQLAQIANFNPQLMG